MSEMIESGNCIAKPTPGITDSRNCARLRAALDALGGARWRTLVKLGWRVGMEILLAILFVDVCDSTRLYEAVGNVRATEIIQGTLNRLHAVVAECGGRVVKSLGDGLMCAFPEAEQAGMAAADMMAVAAEGTPGVARPGDVKLRIGVHFGSAVEGGGDVFGDAVNVTARVESLASPGEILLTDDVVNRLPPLLRANCQFIDTTTVKGKTIPIRIFKLRQGGSTEDSVDCTVISRDAIERVKGAVKTLDLSYMATQLEVSRDNPKVTIGRAENCNVVIVARTASRQHGSIEFSRESFVLTDHSANGTYVRAGNAAPILLRRDSTKLVGSGLLGIGAIPNRIDEEHVIRFVCDVDI